MDKYIYISIPKTGTNSIHEIMGNTNYNHIPANTIKNLLGESNYKSKTSFCFIRNPVDLVKSWYYYHKYSPNVVRQDVKNFYPDTIEEWVNEMNCKTHWELPIHKKYNPHWNIEKSPLHQYYWISDSNENIIVDKVLLFDNINSEIEKLFGVQPIKKNSSLKDDYPLNEKTKTKILEIFHEDLQYYNKITRYFQG